MQSYKQCAWSSKSDRCASRLGCERWVLLGDIYLLPGEPAKPTFANFLEDILQ
jgi:hypothetical protein